MKKLFRALTKGKEKENLGTECYGVDAQDQHLPQIGTFKHYQFEPDCHSTCERLTELFPHEEEYIHGGTYGWELPSGVVCGSLHKGKKSGTEKVCGNGLEVKLGEGCVEEQKGNLSDEGSRFKKCMYVISISNSQNFHIGSQKTINTSGGEPPGDSRRDLKQTFSSNSTVEVEMDWEKLLDCEQKLNEEYIALIAVHMDGRWKEFGRSLGLQQSCLEEDFKNGTNRILTVYDMLYKYLNEFPNTSLGFIINALCVIHHHELIKKLTEFLPDSTLHLATFTHC